MIQPHGVGATPRSDPLKNKLNFRLDHPVIQLVIRNTAKEKKSEAKIPF